MSSPYHWVVLALVLLCCGSCGYEEPPRTLHLFDEEGRESSCPEDLWSDERVWVDEEIQPVEWVSKEGGVLWTSTRFPVAEPGRVVHLTEASNRQKGRERVPGEPIEPSDGKLIIADGAVHFAGPQEPDKFIVAYQATAKSIIALLTHNDAPRLGEPQELRLRAKTRRSIIVQAGTEFSYPVHLDGQAAHLNFGFAALGTELHRFSKGPRLRPVVERVGCIRIEAENEAGKRIPLWQRDLQGIEAWRYHLESVELDSLGSGFFRIYFTGSHPPDAPQMTPFWVWSEPVIEPVRPSHKPNIIVILLDTVRADRLGCYGWERAQTPHIDRLAGNGIRFDDAMSAAPWTLPSHASLFTSSYPSQHSCWTHNSRLATEFVTVAEVLRESGYRTAAFTDGGLVSPQHGLAQGFDEFTVFNFDIDGSFGAAQSWIQGTSGPFFVFLQTYEAHSPYDPPQVFRKRLVRPYGGELPRRVHLKDYKWSRPNNKHRPSDEDIRYLQDLYDAEIAVIDEAVGHMVEFLEDTERLGNTLIVVTSDHGEEFFDHGHVGHGWSLYQEQLHVPLILYWKGTFDGGRVARHPVHGIDIAPTLAAVAGAEIPDSWEGVPLQLEPSTHDRPLFFPFQTHFFHRGEAAAALRKGSIKYVYYPSDKRPGDANPAPALFDLSNDPGERVNLSGDTQDWSDSVLELWERYGPRGTAAAVEMTAKLRADLEALGYVGKDD